MGIDDEFERYRRAAAGVDETPKEKTITHARFEIHARLRDEDGSRADFEDELTAVFGDDWWKTEVLYGPTGTPFLVYTWDVEDPSLTAHLAKNLHVRAAELSKADAYLVWYAATGFPMTYEAGS